MSEYTVTDSAHGEALMHGILSRRRNPAWSGGAVIIWLMCAAAPCAERAFGDDWPQWRGPNRDGVSQETGLLMDWPGSGPSVIWRGPFGEGFSSISIAQGRAYTMLADEHDEFAICLEAATGTEVWRVRLDAKFTVSEGNGPRSTPTIDGRRVYVLSARGRLYALRTESGEKIWQLNLRKLFGSGVPSWGYTASPLIEGETLIIQGGGGSGDNCIAALDKNSGDVIWTSYADAADYSSPIAVTARGLRQVISLTEHTLVSLSPIDGTVYWTYPFKGSINIATPLMVSEDRIFISAAYNKGAALVEMKGQKGSLEVEEIWFSRAMKNWFNPSVVSDGYLYGFDNAILKCIAADKGETQWRQRGFNRGSLILADGHLIVLGEDGRMALVEATPEGYREKARFQALEARCWTPPSLADGKLFVRSEEEIVCLDLTAPNKGR